MRVQVAKIERHASPVNESYIRERKKRSLRSAFSALGMLDQNPLDGSPVVGRHRVAFRDRGGSAGTVVRAPYAAFGAGLTRFRTGSNRLPHSGPPFNQLIDKGEASTLESYSGMIRSARTGAGLLRDPV